MRMIEAQVIDANHLKLLSPLQMPASSKIMITIIPSEETLSEEQSWLQLSQQGLAMAYGEDEPDYPVHLIKHPNPEFQL